MRSRSTTPSVEGGSTKHRPSAARRALMMGLVHERAEVFREPEVPSIPIKEIKVGCTPGGRIQGKKVHQTSDQSVGCAMQEPMLPLCCEVLERVEAMDMSDEEAADILESTPWHVQRWVKDLAVDSEYYRSPILKEPKVTGVEVRPSTCGMTCTSKSKKHCENGSEFDSDFDDEFDESPIEITTMAGVSGVVRDIPDNDELEEPIRNFVTELEEAMDEEADRMLGMSPVFTWVEGYDTFTGVPEQFTGPTPGPLGSYNSPYDVFRAIWTKEILEHIAHETNKYARDVLAYMKNKGTIKPLSRLHKWTDTNADEMMVLFAVFMYMAIDPRSCQKEYWRANDFLELSKFKTLMSYNRYILLSKFLHFVDNSNLAQNHNAEICSQKLIKLNPIIQHLNHKFSSLYNLSKEICIDESLTLFKGRLSWAQAIHRKSARLGIKSYELCESRTGYMSKFEIYTGKNDPSASNAAPSTDLGGKSTQVVLQLLDGLEKRGHCVTMDNFFNCPSLARYLKSQGFDCLSTLRINRRNVPADLTSIPKQVAKGTIISRQCGDVSIVCWKDSKLVSMISTYHNDDTYIGSKSGRVLVKPVCVKDYNSTMGGVDLKDQKLSTYLLERKRGIKWYIKMFKRLLNVSIHNAFVMHNSSMKRVDKLALTHREFRYVLAKSIVDKHHPQHTEICRPVPNRGAELRLRRDILHEPKYEKGPNTRKRCQVCYRQGNTKMVHSQCITCNTYLCFGVCWKNWHSQVFIENERGRKKQRVK